MHTFSGPLRLKSNSSAGAPRRFSDLLPWLLLGVAYFAAVLFQGKYGDDLLNSDMAAEMILAKELNDSGSLFLTENWFYPSELRVLYQHIPMRLGLVLFSENWHLARVFAQAVMLALHAGSFIYMMSALGHKQGGVCGAAALMCPFGFWYTFHGIYSGAYLTHMILMSMTVGLVLNLAGSTSLKKALPRAAVLFVLCIFQGLNGIRMLMSLYAPLCLTVVILFLLRLNRESLATPCYRDPCFKLMASGLAASAACCAGYLYHSLILAKRYAVITYDDRFWTGFSIHDLIDAFSKFLRIFGYPYEGWAAGLSYAGWNEIPLFSLHGLTGAAGIVLISALLFSMFRLFKLWNGLPLGHQAIALLLPACLVVNAIAFTCLTGFSNGSYWLPLVPLAFAAVILWIVNEPFRLTALYQKGAALILLVCVACTSLTSVYQFVHFPPRTAINLKPAAQWLEENGYHQGYATFWYADVLTELSSGTIEVWSLRDPETNPVEHSVYEMLQKRSHAETSPQGPCFILLSQAEYDRSTEVLPYQIQEDTIVYQQDGYVILAYSSIDQALKPE